jgi:hypothetical protein
MKKQTPIYPGSTLAISIIKGATFSVVPQSKIDAIPQPYKGFWPSKEGEIFESDRGGWFTRPGLAIDASGPFTLIRYGRERIAQ